MKSKAENIHPEDNLVGMLEHLYLQTNNFPAMGQFFKSTKNTSSTLFLPQTLQLVDGEITRDPTLAHECYEYLDMLSVFSISIYGSPDAYTKALIEAIVENRFVEDFSSALGENTTTHIAITNRQEMRSLLDANKYLIALYIYSVVNTITYNR